MKSMESMDELSSFFENVYLPQIDVSHKVKDKIANRYKGTPNPMKSRRFSFTITLILVILSTGIVYGAITSWKLFDSIGNMVLNYQEFNEYNAPPPDDKRYESISNSLKPGEAVTIYDKKYPNHAQILSQPVILKSIDEVKSKTQFKFMVPADLPDGYTFKEGSIEYTPIDPYNIQDMANEAKNSNEDIVTKKAKVTNKVNQVVLTYSKNNYKITIDIWQVQGSDLYANVSDKTIEKVKVNGKQALYINYQHEKSLMFSNVIDDSDHEICITKDNKPVKEMVKNYLNYTISTDTSDSSINKNQLITIWQSMK